MDPTKGVKAPRAWLEGGLRRSPGVCCEWTDSQSYVSQPAADPRREGQHIVALFV